MPSTSLCRQKPESPPTSQTKHSWPRRAWAYPEGLPIAPYLRGSPGLLRVLRDCVVHGEPLGAAVSRLVMCGSGAFLMVTLTLIAALVLFPVPAHRIAQPKPKPRCVRSPVISVDWICGGRVYHTNPNGERVYIGKSSALRAVHVHLLETPTR